MALRSLEVREALACAPKNVLDDLGCAWRIIVRGSGLKLPLQGCAEWPER
jgi:hypothetical protein